MTRKRMQLSLFLMDLIINDLTGNYKVGDKLSLKLTTVNIYKDNEYTLESLDYIVNSKKLKDLNTFADIKDYQ